MGKLQKSCKKRLTNYHDAAKKNKLVLERENLIHLLLLVGYHEQDVVDQKLEHCEFLPLEEQLPFDGVVVKTLETSSYPQVIAETFYEYLVQAGLRIDERI